MKTTYDFPPDPIEVIAVRILEKHLPGEFTFEELQLMVHVLNTQKRN